MFGEDAQAMVAVAVVAAVLLALQFAPRRRRRYGRSAGGKSGRSHQGYRQRGPRNTNRKNLRYRLRGLLWTSQRAAKAAQEKLTSAMPGVPVSRLRAIDGDTLENPQTGARFRVANIDCPETGDNAKCYRERVRGEQAKEAAETILTSAQAIELRPVGRQDQYGRTLAHIRVDGQDYGELLIARGVARSWDGTRRPWCGPGGGLALMAAATGTPHACKACRAGTAETPSITEGTVTFPVVFRKAENASDDSAS